VNMLMNFQTKEKTGDFLTNWETNIFSTRTLLDELVSYEHVSVWWIFLLKGWRGSKYHFRLKFHQY
jgi:hypothetical protein